MFAVIYQGYVKPNREAEYKKLWRKIATYFMQNKGALGSCLHKTESGAWLAYSRWPNKAMRDAAWPGEDAPSTALPEDIRQTIIGIKDCLDYDRGFSETCMEVMDDLLTQHA